MNTYFLKRRVLAPLSWLLTLNTNITFCWIYMCLKHKSTIFEGVATFGGRYFRKILEVSQIWRYFRGVVTFEGPLLSEFYGIRTSSKIGHELCRNMKNKGYNEQDKIVAYTNNRNDLKT